MMSRAKPRVATAMKKILYCDINSQMVMVMDSGPYLGTISANFDRVISMLDLLNFVD
jgi:hypothetical protein